MKKLLALLVLWPLSATAQPIHNHPQRPAYASPADWVPISFQCHWQESTLHNPPGVVTAKHLAHTHLEGKWPVYAELKASDRITVDFTLVTFMLDGFVRVVTSGPGVPPHIIWDDTGTEEHPPFVGDPNGEKKWTGKATFIPSEGAEGYDLPRKHGWWFLSMRAQTTFRNPSGGFETDMGQLAIVPYWSMLDPDAPETGIGDGIGEIRSNCGVNADDPGGFSIFGSNSSIIRRLDAPLLAPFNADWPRDAALYGYGIAAGFPPGEYKLFIDPDLHHGNPGRQIRGVTRLFNFEDFTPFSPTEIGLGHHKLAFDWIQSGDGAPTLFNPGEILVSRLVVEVDVTNGPAIPPPPFDPPPPPPPTLDICPNIDGVQLSVPPGMVIVDGKCVPKAPDPVWETFSPFFQRMVVPGQPTKYRVCEDAAGTKCKEVQ